MKIIRLVKSEFIKNYSIKRFLIISVLLIISSLILLKTTNNFENNSYNNEEEHLKESINFYEKRIQELEKKERRSAEEEYHLFYMKKYVEYTEKLKEKKIESNSDWKVSNVYEEILPILDENYFIEKIKANPEDSYFTSVAQKEDSDSLEMGEKTIKKLYEYGIENLEELYKQNKKKIQDYEHLLEEDKYYLYLEYQLKNNVIEKNPFIEAIIEKKQENNNDFLGKNYLQYQWLQKNQNIKHQEMENYQEIMQQSPYKNYIEFDQKLREENEKNKAILLYSTTHEIKHDISYHDYDDVSDDAKYMNSKLKVNQVFHLSAVIMLIVSITSGGIVSNEHSKGTIKNIITAPVERWKILLSKFIYMILDTYIIWFLGLFIISICAGIESGFSDLLTPKLLYTGGKVIEVNYYFYLIKNIFIASIPMICYLSILFFLSTVTLNTSLTVGITSILSVLSVFVWLLSMVGNFKQIVYTPLWYMDCGFIMNNSIRYWEALHKVSYTLSMGIIISLITTIVLYGISNIIYIKRDIKN